MKIHYSLRGYLIGYFQSLAFSVWLSDRWGGLDAYIAHLREPGTWMQLPIEIPVAIFVALLFLYWYTFFAECDEQS